MSNALHPQAMTANELKAHHAWILSAQNVTPEQAAQIRLDNAKWLQPCSDAQRIWAQAQQANASTLRDQ